MTSVRFPLSPIDHFYTGDGAYPIQLLFVYPGRLDETRMRDAWEQLVKHFPPVSCHLVEERGRLVLEYREGWYSLKARRLADEPDIDDTKAVSALFSTVDTHPGEILSQINLWHSPQKSYLAIAFSHSVADGYSFFYLLNSWAQLLQGKGVMEPALDRTVVVPELSAEDKAERCTPETMFRDTGIAWGEKRLSVSDQTLDWKSYHYSTARLEALKAEIKATHQFSLTYNDVVTADLARRLLGPRAEPDESRCYVNCAVDCRRLHPRLSRNFFGNGASFTGYSTTFRELRQAPLGELAQRTREAVSNYGESQILRAVRQLEKFLQQEGPGAFSSLQVANPRGLLVTNLSRVPLDGLDFGTGRPETFRSATPVPRAAMVLPAQDGLGVVYNFPVK